MRILAIKQCKFCFVENSSWFLAIIYLKKRTTTRNDFVCSFSSLEIIPLEEKETKQKKKREIKEMKKR